MVQSLLKSLFLYSALAVSGVLAAPAHQHQSEPLARGVSLRESLQSPDSLAAGLTASISDAFGKRSRDEGKGLKKVTNAVRIAKGLPPLAPRRLYRDSRAGSAHSNARSTVPAVLIYGSDGLTPLGYLSKGLDQYGQYYRATNCTEAMVNPQLVSGALINPAQPLGYSNVGLVAFSTAHSTIGLGTDINDYAAIIGTAATPSGSPPVMSQDHSYGHSVLDYAIESNVWSLGANNELIPTWINPDGGAVPMEIAYLLTDWILTTPNIAMARETAITSSSCYYNHLDDPDYCDPGFTKIRFFIADLTC